MKMTTKRRQRDWRRGFDGSELKIATMLWIDGEKAALVIFGLDEEVDDKGLGAADLTTMMGSSSSWQEQRPEGDNGDGSDVLGSSGSEEMTTTEMERWLSRVDGEEGAPLLAEFGEGVDAVPSLEQGHKGDGQGPSPNEGPNPVWLQLIGEMPTCRAMRWCENGANNVHEDQAQLHVECCEK
ncbi:hypothetical protein [Oryza sativa Japonica Group]|uniref:Uncharacterized protein n=2 Tax=Oryza sativa subsp. japonica TaxID=39947 RepID=Q7F8L7_ORYSJ|nr:hypothetical protein DAI22_01g108200 [Oryza sativa Japonica Group]BAA84631.1 hypothetical protein [Oryza sativa Japonica Group]BAA85206.1 hypothetical protein [Oryza sativa Japonica Group]